MFIPTVTASLCEFQLLEWCATPDGLVRFGHGHGGFEVSVLTVPLSALNLVADAVL